MSTTPSPETAAPARKTIEPVSMTLYETDFQAFSDRLGQSFKRYGFAVIADHGLDEAVINAAIADTKVFFALPEETKRQYHQPSAHQQHHLHGMMHRLPYIPARQFATHAVYWHL